jgi:response regulator RpfG family c-di-GMP phosphodiesterase
LVETRCQRGAEIARTMRFSENVAQGIQNLDEHWDGSGLPLGLTGEAIPVYSRIALLAQVVDVFQIGTGIEAARREVRHRAGTWFDPSLAEAFERATASEHFWRMLRSDDLQTALLALEPAQDVRAIDEDHLDDIAAAPPK